MAAQSLLLPSLSPKIPTNPSSPKTLTLVFSSLSLSKPASLSLTSSSSLSFPLVRNARNICSGMVRRVAMSSDIEEEEEELSGGEEASFSADLKLFVGNLPFNVDSAELADLFERAGAVEMVEVIYDKLTGKSRGFGFVTMSTVEEVEAAVRQFNGYELSGRILRVNSGPPPRKDEFQSKGFRTGSSFDNPNRGFRTGSSFDNPNRGFRTGSSYDNPNRGFRTGSSSDSPNRGFRTGSSIDSTNRVYVGNLSWGVDNLALETLFSEQGKVMEAKVVYDRESGRSRGFGFVTYGSAKEVNDAISSLDGVDLDGRRIRVTAAEERPRRQF